MSSTRSIQNSNKSQTTNQNNVTVSSFQTPNKNQGSNKREDKKKKFQIQILAKLSAQRKNQNYSQLKQWDEQRAHKLTTHRRAISQIMIQIQKKLKYSNQYLQTILKFLSQKGQQFKKYTSYTVVNPKLFNESNLVSLSFYKNTNNALNSCYQLNNQYQKQIKQIIQPSIKNIIKNVQVNLSETQLQITIFKEKLNSVSLKLQQQNQQTSQKCTQLANNYHRQKNQNTFKCEIDFYTQQYFFIRKASLQTNTQCQLGLETTKFIDIMIQIQLNRAKIIKESLVQFFKLMQSIKHSKMPYYLAEQLRKDQQNKLTLQYYSAQQLVGVKLVKEIKQQLKMPKGQPLTLLQLKNYLSDLQFIHFQNRNLILKECKAYFKNNEGNLLQTTIVITIDGFLHLYNSGYSEGQQADFSFKLDDSIKIQHQNDTELKISCICSNSFMRYILGKKNNEDSFQFNIYFANQDQKQQFCQFVQKIIQ